LQVFKQIENEVTAYTEGQIEIFDGYRFSQNKLIRRIYYYLNQIYPKGKLDSHNNYKYWFDIIAPRVDSEVKNIDFDSKDIKVYSNSDKDNVRVLISNAYLSKWLRDTGQGDKINDAVEQGSSWGNVVWKKVKGGYELVDLTNFYLTNQTAKTLEDTDVIERHKLTQAELRAKNGIWKNIEEVINNCGNRQFTATTTSSTNEIQTPIYEVYERNGEVSEETLFEAQGRKGGKPDKYVIAKIIVSGIENTGKMEGKYVLFAEETKDKPYKEYHRGRYQGRWWRVGIVELLMDIQTRSNEIGNQISRGLEWASKAIFKTKDKVIAQNLLDDLTNGDIIKGDISQIELRMQGLDQLMADWNRLMGMADKLTNSYEVVTGETLPSGTPFRLGAMMNQNANKLFNYIREKLTISLGDIVEEWILPEILRDLKVEEMVEITGDEDLLVRYYEVLVNTWYIKNLLVIGPHTQEEAKTIKDLKMGELLKDKQAIIKLQKEFWTGFKPRAMVDITGERVALGAELESLATFIELEQDPIRRTALIEMAMSKKGIDIEKLPKTEVQPQQPQQQPQGQPKQMAGQLQPQTK